jgi:hypothetical protein
LNKLRRHLLEEIHAKYLTSSSLGFLKEEVLKSIYSYVKAKNHITIYLRYKNMIVKLKEDALYFMFALKPTFKLTFPIYHHPSLSSPGHIQ